MTFVQLLYNTTYCPTHRTQTHQHPNSQSTRCWHFCFTLSLVMICIFLGYQASTIQTKTNKKLCAVCLLVNVQILYYHCTRCPYQSLNNKGERQWEAVLTFINFIIILPTGAGARLLVLVVGHALSKQNKKQSREVCVGGGGLFSLVK